MKRNPRTIEMRNRLELIHIAFEIGYVSYLPVVDEGIDLILFRETDRKTEHDFKLIQLKSRWTICKKYRNRDIWIAFPEAGKWYLAPHDKLIEMAGRALHSQSWTHGGEYSRKQMSPELTKEMQAYLFPCA